MPKQTAADFAAAYKAKYPQFANMNDDELIRRVTEDHPEVKSQIDNSTLLDNVVTGGLRIGGAVVGGVLGGLGSSPSVLGVPLGVIAGGAAGAGGGEALAEKYEQARGLRDKMNPYQIGTQAAIGAIPVKGINAGVSLGKAALMHGAQGALINTAATAATGLAEEGKLPGLGDLATSGAMGAVLGGAGGALAARAKAPVSAASAIAEMERIRQTRLAAQAQQPNVLDKLKALPNKLTTRFIDQFNDLRNYETGLEAEKGFQFRPAQKPSEAIDRAWGGSGGNITNKADAFKAVMDDAKKANLEQPLTDFLDLNGYAHASRTLEDKAIGLIKSPDWAERQDGLKLLQELHTGQSLPEKLTPVGVQSRLRQLEQSMNPTDWQNVQGLGQRVFDENRNTLDRLNSAGIISDPLHLQLRGRGDDYVPMLRIMGDDAPGPYPNFGSLDLKNQRVLYNLEGSERTNIHPIVASFERAQEAEKEIARNTMGRSVADLNRYDPSHIRQLAPNEAAPKGYGELGFYDQGRRVRYMAPQPIADALSRSNNLGDLPGSAVLRATQQVSQKMMTALNVAFSLANVPKDIYDTRVLSPVQERTKFHNPATWISGPKDFAKFMGEWAQSWKQVMEKSPEYRDFLASGASYSTLQKSLSPESFMGGNFNPSLAQRVLHKVESFSNANEVATKLTTFKRAIAQGLGNDQAATITRNLGGSPDFARRGTHGVAANQLFTFFNAQMQGLSRNLRAIVPHPGATDNPERMQRLMGIVASATVSAAALDNWNRGFTDPDGVPSIERVSNQERQSNWIFMRPSTYTTSEGVTRHQFLKLPKGHIARLIHNPIEAVLEDLRGPKAFTTKQTEQVGLDFLGNVIPGSFNLKAGDVGGSLKRGLISSLNPLPKSVLEWWTNTDNYRNIPIEAKRLQGINVPERYTPATSPLMRGVSKTLDKVGGLATTLDASPAQLQHAFSNFLPGPGEMALNAADLAAGKSFAPNKGSLEGDEQMSRMPIVGPVARRIWGSSLDQVNTDREETFYNALQQADQATKTFAALKQRSPQEAMGFMQDPRNQKLKALFPVLTRISQQLATIRHQRERIQTSTNPNARQLLGQLGQVEANIMKQADAIVVNLTGGQ